MSEPSVTSLTPRFREDVAAMAVVAQANVLQLQVAAHKRSRTGAPSVPSPGPVLRFRDALIGWRDIRQYTEPDLILRTHQVWGQYCLFCWVFFGRDPRHPPPFADLPPDEQMRCAGELGSKLLDVERGLWRLRHEERFRHQPALRRDRDFQKQQERALETPMMVFGQNVRVCHDSDLLACTCEYAGMLAAVRWAADDRWSWGQDGIMELDGRPG